jgi:hypothetical protein
MPSPDRGGILNFTSMYHKKIFYILFIAATAFLLSCEHGKQNVMPEINTADSLTIIYYNNPPDTRFFKVVKGKKTADLKTLVDEVNRGAVQKTASCESIGKIYFYKGTEQVYIIYFSDGDCGRLSFIKNGERYESKMSQSTFNMLEGWKQHAVEPIAK